MQIETDVRYGGWTYFVDEEDHGDSIKIIHTAKHESGQERHVPHTPYEHLRQSDFEFHVRNQFKRMGNGNWFRKHIDQCPVE